MSTPGIAVGFCLSRLQDIGEISPQGLFGVRSDNLTDFCFDASYLIGRDGAPSLPFIGNGNQLVSLAIGIGRDDEHALPDQTGDSLLGGLAGVAHLAVDLRKPEPAPSDLRKDAHISGPYICKFCFGAGLVYLSIPGCDQRHHQAFDILAQKFIILFINHN